MKQNETINIQCSVLYQQDQSNQRWQSSDFSTHNTKRKTAEFTTGRHVEPDFWSMKQCKVASTTKGAREINSYLELIKSILLLKKRELEENGRQITVIDLKNAYLGIDDSDKTILQVFKEHNERAEGLIS